ncbi:MAG: sulfite exporter TauE/SafE family protein [Aeromicrobium sp.]|nr:sulfite exporter TauE/SafE family protein [Burkholderiales bacterium]
MLIVAGALTGLVEGITGVGGGARMTPLLLFFDVAPLTAVGTDLWFATTTKLFATRIHHRHWLIGWQIAKHPWWSSLPASAATRYWQSVQPVNGGTMKLMKVATASAVIMIALGMLFQSP